METPLPRPCAAHGTSEQHMRQVGDVCSGLPRRTQEAGGLFWGFLGSQATDLGIPRAARLRDLQGQSGAATSDAGEPMNRPETTRKQCCREVPRDV